MRAEHVLDGHKKWWISGGAAVFAHLAVMLALPDALPRESRCGHSGLSEFAVTTVASAHDDVAATQRSGGDASSTAGTPSAVHAARAALLRSRTETPRAATLRSRTEATPAATTVRVPASAGTAQTGEARAGAAAPLGEFTAGGVDMGGEAGARGGAAAGHGGGRAPGLLAAQNPCSGYFPATARVNQGAVQLSVRVDAEGHTRAARILNELPAGQEFGRAARACAAALRFVPASNALGLPIAGEAKLELRFSRS